MFLLFAVNWMLSSEISVREVGVLLNGTSFASYRTKRLTFTCPHILINFLVQ